MQIGVETSRAVESKRVFVVDDDEITRAVLQFILQDENETHDLAELADAYAKADAGGAPDLVLLGLGVVRREGAALLDALRGRWPSARVLLIAEASETAEAERAGAHGVLGKPFTVETVRRKADVQLSRVVPSLVQISLLPAGA